MFWYVVLEALCTGSEASELGERGGGGEQGSAPLRHDHLLLPGRHCEASKGGEENGGKLEADGGRRWEK